jgi:hypothetical protein
VSRPWKRASAWPHVAKNGRKSYSLGFYDHEGTGRTRSFSSTKEARQWREEYTAAERRGAESLRRFLLDLDAKEANQLDARTIGEIVELYFALDADPSLEGGLAPSTFASYRCAANCHILGRPLHNAKGEPLPPAPYAVALASQPAVLFNEPQAPRQWARK